MATHLGLESQLFCKINKLEMYGSYQILCSRNTLIKMGVASLILLITV